MGLFLLSLVVVIVMVYCFYRWVVIDDDDIIAGLGSLGILTGVIVFSFIITCSYTGNISRIAEMDAFVETNKAVYVTTITDTALILSPESANTNIVLQGSVEKVNVGAITAERMKELRDQVTKYNNDIASFRALKNNWFTGWLYPDVPGKLKYIAIR